MSGLATYQKYKKYERFIAEINNTSINRPDQFYLMSHNHELMYNFFADAPDKTGYQTAHFYGCKGSGKTTTGYHALDYLFKLVPDVKGFYLKNAIKELSDIKREFVSLGNNHSKDSIHINDGVIDFGYFTTRGLNSKHGGSYDIVIIEEAQICNDLEELEQFAKMLLRGGKHQFKLLVYIYNPDVSGRNNFDLLRLQQQANLIVQFLPQDNPILYNQKPQNYWDILGEGLSEDAYKGWILGDLNIVASDSIFHSSDIIYDDYNFINPKMYIDPAVAEEYTQGSLSACTIIEQDKDKNIHILSYAVESHIENAKIEFLKLAKKHNVSKVIIETNQGGFSVKKSLQDTIKHNTLDINVKSKHNTIDKEERIRMINLYDKKKIFFHRDTNNHAYQQILRYSLKEPKKHSDTLDSVAGALDCIKKLDFTYIGL